MCAFGAVGECGLYYRFKSRLAVCGARENRRAVARELGGKPALRAAPWAGIGFTAVLSLGLCVAANEPRRLQFFLGTPREEGFRTKATSYHSPFWCSSTGSQQRAPTLCGRLLRWDPSTSGGSESARARVADPGWRRPVRVTSKQGGTWRFLLYTVAEKDLTSGVAGV